MLLCLRSIVKRKGVLVEILAIIGILAIGYGLWLWFRFTSFRKRLLDAFQLYGLPRHAADNLYTIHNGIINDLHVNRGLSPELIAVAILEEYGKQ